MGNARNAVILQYFLLMVIILVGAYLRLANLRTNPGWYPDEGSDLNIAWNLWQGRLQYFAVGGSLLVAARAPLFHLILVGLFNIFGYDILIARMVSAIAGWVTIPLLFFTLKGSLGEWKALSTAAFFAIFPLAVLYNRWAFTYNLLMPLSVICFWALLRVIETGRVRWMLLAASSTALSILTAWVAVSLIVCMFFVGWFYQRRALVWSIPLALILPVAFLVITYQYSPTAFTQDFALTFSRSTGSILVQFASAMVNYPVFVASNYWLALGIIGFFLIEPRRLRALVFLVFFITLFSVLRFSIVAEVAKLGFYRVLGLVPFLAMGITIFFFRAIPFALRLVADDLDQILARVGADTALWPLIRHVVKSVTVPVFVYLVIVSVVSVTLLSDVLSIPTQFQTRAEDVLATPPADALAAIEYVNTQAQPDDVVIASPQIGWAVRARAVDFQQTLSYEGFPTDNYPTPLGQARFVFDPTPANARFAIVDRMWRLWAVEKISAMPYLLNVVDRWPIAFRAGDFTVYRNPAR